MRTASKLSVERPQETSDQTPLRLTALNFHELATHFLALSAADRALRFGRPMDDAAVVQHVNRVDFARDAVFAINDKELDLAGVAHLTFGDDTAELGLSVLQAARARGLGMRLLRHACAYARSRGVHTLFMHCLATNEAIHRLALKAGMKIRTAQGESAASLALEPEHAEAHEGDFALADATFLARYRAEHRRRRAAR
jgi:RimJ/RimL family protein N-acetyltransferase